jgi:hypothetical protein
MLKLSKKFERPFFFMLAFIWVIGYAFLVGEATQHQKDRIEIEAAQKTANSVNKNESSRDAASILPRNKQTEDRSDEGKEVTIVGLKLGEALLAFITVLLWLATRDLVAAATDTGQRQLRAYVSVETGTNVRQSRKKRCRFEFRPNVINNGQTPAYDVRMFSKIDVVPPNISDDFNYAVGPVDVRGPRSVSSIGPRQSKFQSCLFYRDLTRAEMREIATGSKAFHVWGVVVYNDAFKIERHTYFSFVIFVPKKSNPTYWLITEKNNHAD